MQPFFGLFNLGGGEIVLILALILILFGAKKLPDLAKGLGKGIFEFRRRVDEESAEAGRSLGGIYGKAATEALTPHNQVAELYDPACLRNDSEPQKRSNFPLQFFTKFMARLRRLLRLKRSTS